MRSKITLLVASLCLALSLGCGAMQKAAKATGAKAVDNTIAITDLGSDYSPFADTDFDVFSDKAGENQVKITYKTVSVKSIDTYNKDAETLYAQYIFANKTLDHVSADLAKALDLDASKSFEEITKAATSRKNKKKITAVQNAENLKESVTLALKSLSEMPTRASGLVTTGQALVTSAPKEMAKKPKTALLSDVALAEIKTSLEHSKEVVAGAPELLEKVTKLKEILF